MYENPDSIKVRMSQMSPRRSGRESRGPAEMYGNWGQHTLDEGQLARQEKAREKQQALERNQAEEEDKRRRREAFKRSVKSMERQVRKLDNDASRQPIPFHDFINDNERRRKEQTLADDIRRREQTLADEERRKNELEQRRARANVNSERFMNYHKPTYGWHNRMEVLKRQHEMRNEEIFNREMATYYRNAAGEQHLRPGWQTRDR
jgi:phage-related minor tail protein